MLLLSVTIDMCSDKKTSKTASFCPGFALRPVFGSINTDAPLDMPQLSRQDIQGLRRTFVLYSKLPKEYWPQIERAETFDEEGNKIFTELSDIYQKQYQ